MKKITQLTLVAAIVPALLMVPVSAWAQDAPEATESDEIDLQEGQMDQDEGPGQDDPLEDALDDAMEQENGFDDPGTETHPTALPPSGFYADELQDAEVRTQQDNENIGTVDSLIIDDAGDITAVVVSYGGVLGLGQRQVAISWDRVERSMEEDRVVLHIDMTVDELENAPDFTRD